MEKKCVARGDGLEGAPACKSNAQAAKKPRSCCKEEYSSCLPGLQCLLPRPKLLGGRCCCQLQRPLSRQALLEKGFFSVMQLGACCTLLIAFAGVCETLTVAGHSLSM